MRRIAFALALIASPALANSPPEGSPDWQAMHPYATWIERQKSDAGGACCSMSDGRPVDVRIVDGHWQAHVTPDHWPGVRDQWVTIPDELVIHGGNPTGLPILWLYVPHKYRMAGMCDHCEIDEGPDATVPVNVYCFAPPDAS